MSENWQVFKPEELDTISFMCPNCKTVMVFPASGEVAGRQRNCPGCNKEIPGAGELLRLYAAFHREATKEQHQQIAVSLRTRVQE